MSSNATPRICILGGGFGGLYTAVRLESLMWPHSRRPQITLIDQNERFVFKPLLYELINGGAKPEEVAPLFSDLLASMTSTSFVQGSVDSVHSDDSMGSVNSSNAGGTITLVDGQQLQYDWLVLALGSSTSFFGIPGVKELALPFNDFKDAMRVLRRVEEIEARPPGVPADVVVVGAGYAGVELATTVAERLGNRAAVQLVSAGGDILEGMPPGQVKVARKMLQDLHIKIVTNAMVSSIRQEHHQPSTAKTSTSQRVHPAAAAAAKQQVHIKLPSNSKSTVHADMVLWTAGSSPASHAARKLKLPFKTNKQGALLTDRNLRVVQQQRVFALGDVAGSEVEAQTANIPPTAQVAFQQADYVAWNLWSSINARPLLPFKYQHLGDMMSLGAAPRCHCYAATLLILALQCICKLPSIIPLVTTLWSCTVLSSLLLHSMSKGFPVEAQRLGPRACCKSALSVPSFLWWFRAREWRCDTPGAGVAPAGEQSSGRSPQFPPGCSRHQLPAG
ncbi:hypothetical protein ABBQ32_002435 [Trebouxia sp. C0010 RCD-2024]